LGTWLKSVAVIFCASLACHGQQPPKPEEFLRSQMQLSPGEIADIQEGKAVAKILRSSNPSDIFVFGAVYITSMPDRYLQLMRDIDRLGKLSGYMGAGEFSASRRSGGVAPCDAPVETTLLLSALRSTNPSRSYKAEGGALIFLIYRQSGMNAPRNQALPSLLLQPLPALL